MQTVRTLEYLKGENPFPTRLRYLDTVGLLDQFLLNDAVCSCIAQRPLYLHLAGPPRGTAGWTHWRKQHASLCPLIDASQPLPPSWEPHSLRPDLRCGVTCLRKQVIYLLVKRDHVAQWSEQAAMQSVCVTKL